jgi:hypothetical protein
MEKQLLDLFNKYIKYKGYLTVNENNAFGDLLIFLNNIVNNNFELVISCDHVYEKLNNTTGTRQCIKCGQLVNTP